MSGFFKLIQIATLAFLLLPGIDQVLSKRGTRRKKLSTEGKIERFVEEVCECRNINGLTLAVVRGDDILMTKGFGYRDLKRKKKVDSRTRFGIAGLSKAFTAATLVEILQKSNIKLSTPLKEFVNITFSNEQLNNYTTLEDILSHRTGLIENNYLRFNPNFTRRTNHKFLKYFDVQQDFRTGFIYNNVMYGLASYITELLTDTTWENAVRTHLLKPLGMDKVTFSETAKFAKLNIAHPYLNFQGQGFQRISYDFMKKWAELGGSGGIYADALDMSRWMRFLLNKGELNKKRIMDSKLIEDLFKGRNHPGSRTTFMRPDNLITVSDDIYGLGWRKGYYRGIPMITHTGSTWGYKAMLTLFPVQKLGIFTAQIGSDDKYIKRRLLHSYIADQYLGEQSWLNHTSACSFPWKSSKKKTIKKRATRSSPKLDKRYDYAGTYSNQLWGDLHIEKTRNGLKMIYGYASFMLEPTSNPLFFRAVGTEEIWFLKLSSVKFEATDKTKKRMVSVTVPPFERRMPPKFDKIK